MPWSQSNLSVFKTKTDKEHYWADWEGCDRTNIYVAGFPRQNYRSSLYQHNFTVCRVSTFFHCTCSLNVWFRLTKCRLTRFRRPDLPMISSVVCLCVFMWKDGHAWLYGGWTAARMGIGKEFTNPKFVTVYQDFGILLNWYKLPLCSCMSNRHLPLFFGSSSPCTWRINDWLSCFFMTGMQKILKILRVNILSQGRTWLLIYFTNGLHCDFKKLCNWIIFSVFIF